MPVLFGSVERYKCCFTEAKRARRYSSNCNLMNSSEPRYASVEGLEGFFGSQVDVTVCVRKSIQRRSAAERANAVRNEGNDIVIEESSRFMRMSL